MTNPTPDHRSLPRKKRAPSSRDQAIYLAYKTTGSSQAKLAEDNHLSQRRISEIVRRIERWRANLIPAAAGELDHHQSQRLERWLEQQRLQSIYDRAIRDYDTQQTELKTTRNGDRDGKKYHDETTRQVPQNVQLLKVAIRAAEGLGKLNDKPAPAATEPKDVEQRFWQVHTLIRELRRDNGIPQDESLWSKDFASLTTALHNLINKEPASPPNPSQPSNPKSQICNSQFAVCNLNSDPPASSESEPEYSSNCSNPSPSADSPADFPAPAATPTPAPLSATPSDQSNPRQSPSKKPAPPVLEPEPSLAERRLRHSEKIEQLQEARRRGLPCLIEFDPEDGPIPPTCCHIDDYGYQPSPPPTSAEIHEQNEHYLAQLRAENEANNRRMSQPA